MNFLKRFRRDQRPSSQIPPAERADIILTKLEKKEPDIDWPKELVLFQELFDGAQLGFQETGEEHYRHEAETTLHLIARISQKIR
jgi:hypothetical protein